LDTLPSLRAVFCAFAELFCYALPGSPFAVFQPNFIGSHCITTHYHAYEVNDWHRTAIYIIGQVWPVR